MEERASVQISTKSWHYRLMKYVLGQNAPEPRSMRNLCPYFWLLIFTLLVSVPYIPLKLIFQGLNKVTNFLDSFLIVPIQDKRTDIWYEKLDEFDVFMMWKNNENMKKFLKTRLGNEETVIRKWLKDNLNISMYIENSSWNKTDEFNQWTSKMYEEYNEIQEISRQKKLERQNKEEAITEKISDVRHGIDNFFNGVGDKIMSLTTLIKWTKRVVGLIITALGLTATYFIVSFIGKFFLLGVVYIKAVGIFLLSLLIICAAVGTIIFIAYVLSLLVSYIKENGSANVWWVAIFYYPFLFLLFWPVKIVFVLFLWELILKTILLLIYKSARGLGKGFMNFLGIFGEYFGSSYTDYCPALEWEEEDK